MTLSLDGIGVTAQATIAESGITFVPGANLDDGPHTVALHVADLTGVASDVSWNFGVDTVPPTTTITLPADGTTTNTTNPTFMATFSDPAPGSGIAVGGIIAALDGQDVTTQSTLTATSISFIPGTALADGGHVFTLKVPDLAGNIGIASAAITVLTTPPPAPVVQYYQESATQVVVVGLLPAGYSIASLGITVNSTSTGNLTDVSSASALTGGTFQATLKNTSGTVTNFAAGLFFTDSAGNVGAMTPITNQFANNPSNGDPTNLPPAPPVISSLQIDPASLTGDMTGTNNGENVSFTKNTFVTVNATISAPLGTLDSITFTGGLQPVVLNGGASSGTFTASIPVPVEGRFALGVSAVAVNSGQYAEAELPAASRQILIVDRTPPAIVFSNPSPLTTAPMNFLYLNGMSEAQSAAIRTDSDLPRNVYSRDGMELMGDVNDALSDLSGNLTFEVREDDDGSDMATLLQQTPIRTVAVTGTAAPKPNQPHHATFDQTGATAGLPDSTRVENNTYITGSYLLTLKGTDKAGNTGSVNFWVTVKTDLPQGVDWVGNHWNGDGCGPLVGVAPEGDAVRVYDSGGPLKLSGVNSAYWMLNGGPVSVLNGYTGVVALEDLAGNKNENASFTAQHYNAEAGHIWEGSYGSYDIDLGNQPPEALYNIDLALFFDSASASGQSIALQGDELDPNSVYNFPTNSDHLNFSSFSMWNYGGGPLLYLVGPLQGSTTTPVANRFAPGTFTVNGNTYVEVPPSWSDPRTYSYAATGTCPLYPQTSFYFNDDQDQAFIQQLLSTVIDYFTGNSAALSGDTISNTTSKQFGGVESPGSPGLNAVNFAYGSQWNTSDNQYYTGTDTTYPDFQDIINYFNQAGGYLEASASKPRAFTVFSVSPDTLRAGQRQTITIQGWFGDGIKIGSTVGVSIAPSGGSGNINIVPADPTAPLAASGNGLVVLEDPYNATALQTVQLDVIPDGTATGVFDVVAGGFTLHKMLNVVHFGLLVDANHDGTIDGNDYPAQRTIHPVVMAPGFGQSGHPGLDQRLQVNLDVDDSQQWLDGTKNSAIVNRGAVSLTTNNKRVKMYIDTTTTIALTPDDLTFEHVAVNLYPYFNPDGTLIDPTTYYTDGTYLYLIVNTTNPDGTQTTTYQNINLTDQLKWRRQSDQALFDDLPASVYLDFPSDEAVALTISGGGGGVAQTQTLKLLQLSNGLGADSLAPTHTVIPGFASINLTRGNLFVGATASNYVTPLMGPDVSFYYNHLDGLKTAFGPGWRSNYDLRLVDNSSDTNGDGIIQIGERAAGDLLVFVDETGRRFLFRYDSQNNWFASDPKGGLIGATVTPDANAPQVNGMPPPPDPRTTDKDGTEHAYAMQRNDNHVYFFDKCGRLERIENLRHEALTVARDASGNAIAVIDKNGRGESLDAGQFGASSVPLDALSGRQLPSMSFLYDSYDTDNVHPRINQIQIAGFSHTGLGADTDTYTIGYNDSSKVNSVSTAGVSPASVVYTPDTRLGASSAVVTDYIGGTNTYAITPDQDYWTSFTDPANVTTSHAVDPSTRRMSSSTRGGYTVSMKYDSGTGSLTSSAVGGGTSTTYTYTNFGGGIDASGIVNGSNLLASSTLSGAGTTTYTYFQDDNLKGLLQTVSDPTGASITHSYDSTTTFETQYMDQRGFVWTVAATNYFGQPTQTISPLNRKTNKSYDWNGRLLRTTDNMNYTTSMQYDSMGRLSTVTQPGGAFTQSIFDPCGRVVSSTDLVGREDDTLFDVIGRPTSIHTQGIGDVTVTYSASGPGQITVTRTRGARTLSIDTQDLTGRTLTSAVPRVLSGTTSTNVTTTYTYTPESWVATIIDPNNGITTNHYNGAGWLTSVTSRGGGTSSTVFDTAGRVTSRTDLDGNTVSYLYDNDGRVTQTTNPAGGTVKTQYDLAGHVLSVIPSLGAGESFTYDNDGYQSKHTDTLGKVTVTTIDDNNRAIVTNIDDDPNRTVTRHLNALAQADKIDTVFGTTSLTLRPDGVEQQIQAPGRGDAAINRDDLDRVTSTSVTGAGGTLTSTSATFDPTLGDLQSTTNPLALTTKLNRDPGSGDVTNTSDNVVDGENFDTNCTINLRDNNGNVLQYQIENPDGQPLVFNQHFTPDDYRDSITGPDNVKTQFTLTKGGRVDAVTVGDLPPVSMKYNPLDQPTTVTDPSGRQTSNVYDALGLQTSTSSGGLTTTYVFDPNTRLLKGVNNPGGLNVVIDRDDFGRPIKIHDPMGNITQYAYNSKDQVTTIIHPDAITESFTYKPNGDIDTHTDRMGRTTALTQDELGRVTQKIFDTGETITTGYNGAGMVTNESSSLNGAVGHQFDGRGRLLVVTQGGAAVSFTYRNDNQIATKIDGNKTLTYNYNPSNARLQYVDGKAFGRMDILSYDNDGRVTSVQLPNNLNRTFNYDGAGRTTNMTQTLGASSENFNYTYDSSGRLLSIGSTNWNLNLTYDSGGRLAVENRTGDGSYRHNFKYDANDNRTQMVSVLSPTVQSNVLDFSNGVMPSQAVTVTGDWGVVGGKLSAIGSGSTQLSLALGANAQPPYTVKVQPNTSTVTVNTGVIAGIDFAQDTTGYYFVGLAVTVNAGVLVRSVKLVWIPTGGNIQVVAEAPAIPYDGSELTLNLDLSSTSVVANILEDNGTIADLNATVTSVVGGVGLEAAPYPVGAGIVQSTFNDFTWQSVSGGTETRNYTYNAINQLMSIRGAEATDYGYDLAGRMTQQTQNGVLTAFDYDRSDRLTSVTSPTSTSTYGYYGPSWMRASATVNGVSTSYIHDGFACVAQTTNGVTTDYMVPGSTPAWESTAGQILSYAQDGRGNVTGLWNGTGYVQRFQLDAFGNVTTLNAANQIIPNTSGPRYGAQMFDAPTGTYGFGPRTYNPLIGGFTSMDPIGAGTNHYSYCQSDPINRSDFSGLKWEQVQGIWTWVNRGDGPEPTENTPFPPGTRVVYETPWHQIIAVADKAGYDDVIGIHNNAITAAAAGRKLLAEADAASEARLKAYWEYRRTHWSAMSIDEKIYGIAGGVTTRVNDGLEFQKEGVFLGLDILSAGELGLGLGAAEEGVSLARRGARALEEEVAEGGGRAAKQAERDFLEASEKEDRLLDPHELEFYGGRSAEDLHHALPQYLGGLRNQTLTKMPRDLHIRFHTALDRWKGGIYSRVSGAQNFKGMSINKIINDLREFYQTAESGLFKKYAPDLERAFKETLEATK